MDFRGDFWEFKGAFLSRYFMLIMTLNSNRDRPSAV